MSVSGLSVYNGPFEDFLITIDRIEVPNQNNFEDVYAKFESLVATGEIAAFIYEPLVQGAAAMKMYDRGFLERILEIAKKYQVLTVADEVMTGFGKTGKNFASDYMETKPDIICMSKSLTAGVAPMAITSCTKEVYNSFYDNEIKKGFFHGHTYSANPLACSAAIAGIELLQSDHIQQNIELITKRHLDFKEVMDKHPKVKSTRVLGVIFALDLNIDMKRYGKLRDKLYQFYMKNGVFLRPLGNTIYILPPFVISEAELKKIYSVIERSLDIV